MSKFMMSIARVFHKSGPRCILSHTASVQQIHRFLPAGVIQLARTITARDPSRIDPARITVRRGPKKRLRTNSMRNLPRRDYKDGDHVYANEVLRVQRSAVQWKAGQYVITGSNKTLNAQVSGTLKLTTEIDHDKVSFKRKKAFTDVLPDEALLRTVVHVIPDEQHSHFKLVEQI